MTNPDRRRRVGLFVAVLASGVSGLTWEVLWQHHTGLALGVSAFGTAITLAAMMAGLGLGGLAAAWLARQGRLRRPLLAYGIAELVIGVSAVLVPLGLRGLALIDGRVYPISAGAAAGVQLLGTALLLLVPASAMGATIPILAPYAPRVGTNVAVVYALNLAGAVVGVLVATFVSLPLVGVRQTGLAAAALNLSVALWAIRNRDEAGRRATEADGGWPPAAALGLAFTSGLVIFALEVSWFRSIRAALQATTESFALILAAFLLALAAGGWLAPRLRSRWPGALGWVLPLAGLAVLAATPAVDAFDQMVSGWTFTSFTFVAALRRLAWTLAIVAPPVTLLGMIFPWLLAEHGSTSGTGRLYAVNTVGAVAGALVAGFVLLPTAGATRTSWLAGLVVLGAAMVWKPRLRTIAAAAVVAALGLAVAHRFASPAGERVRGPGAQQYKEILYVAEGPDSTVWVARNQLEVLDLIIDGFSASGEDPRANYMRWMGHLPALAVAHLRRALVICFGTGQTADAVRQHGPAALEVVDVNAAVFRAAPLFRTNHGVLDDPVVRAVVMDGRAYLRRQTEARFDLVTLEPMPPNFAGSNNLYSREFYELVRRRLRPGGVAAQWVPFHLVAPRHMVAIVATFHAVFPYTRLWLDPVTRTGILVGGGEPWQLRPSVVPLGLPAAEIESHFELDWEAVAAFTRDAPLITDDNQLLAYGLDRLARNPGQHRRLNALNTGLVIRFGQAMRGRSGAQKMK